LPGDFHVGGWRKPAYSRRGNVSVPLPF